MSYCRWTDGDVYAYESDYGVQFWIAGNKSLDRVCRTHIEAYQYAKELRDVHGVSIPDYAIETLREESVDERERLLGILETIANVIERDYVRRESIEEVMDNDRALVEENSMLAGELPKLRAELEKATNNLNSANKDFENARAELVAECDELKELNEYHALQYELASEDADRLQAQVDGLHTATNALTERIAEPTAELDAAKQQISQFDAPKSVETSENPASKCEISDFDDSREQLEADVLHHVEDIRNKSGWTGVCANYGTVIEWLDRQAAITEEQTRCKWVTASADEIAAWRSKAEKLKEQVYELTAERDNWKANCKDWKKDCERYREKFGKCLDYADAIHALMDDEGLA